MKRGRVKIVRIYPDWPYQLLRHWRIDCKALFFKTRKWKNRKLVQSQLTFFLSYHKRFHTFSNFDSNKTDDTSVLRRNQPNWSGLFVDVVTRRKSGSKTTHNASLCTYKLLSTINRYVLTPQYCPERHSPVLSLPAQKDPRGCTVQIMHRKKVHTLSLTLC